MSVMVALTFKRLPQHSWPMPLSWTMKFPPAVLVHRLTSQLTTSYSRTSRLILSPLPSSSDSLRHHPSLQAIDTASSPFSSQTFDTYRCWSERSVAIRLTAYLWLSTSSYSKYSTDLEARRHRQGSSRRVPRRLHTSCEFIFHLSSHALRAADPISFYAAACGSKATKLIKAWLRSLTYLLKVLVVLEDRATKGDGRAHIDIWDQQELQRPAV